MEKKIIKTTHKLSKKLIPHHKFKIKQKHSKIPFHVRPNLFNVFRKKSKRKYTIIIPMHKITEISKMSEKQLEDWLKNDMAMMLESQNMPPIKLAGFTIQYLLNKRKLKN
jgi:hypothetical protein